MSVRLVSLVLACLFALAGSAAAQGLTPAEIVGLFKLGYTEAEIRAEVKAAGRPIALAPADLQALKEAGASEAFLVFLKEQAGPQAPAAARITVAEVTALVQAGRPVGEILDRIAQGAEPLTAAGSVGLTRAGAHLALILALKAEPLGAAELEQLGPTGLALADYRKLLAITGFAGPLPPARALALTRAGVPAEIVAEARKGQAAPQGPPAGPAPEGRSRQRPGVLSKVEGGLYTHPGRRFRVRLPEGWSLLRDLHEGKVRYTFTPEEKKTRVDELLVGLSVSVDPLDRQSVYGGKSARAILEYILPAIAVLEPDMVQEGPVAEAKLGALPAARALFHGRPKGREGLFTAEVTLAEVDGAVYTAVAMAPRSGFGGARPIFEKILDGSEFGHLAYARHGALEDDTRLVERYKGSVVYVETAYEGLGNMGQGTGFIISRDGYVLTNWHVVWDMQNNRPGKSFTVHWDDSLKRPPVKAELVGVEQRDGKSGNAIGGVDVALLKIPSGDYEPIPLSPSTEVRLGDPILALGFPKSFELTGLSMFITKGVLVRFNRSLDGNLESLTTDAKITHGNSGGPCFSLKTGGVIGLNTWGNTKQDYAGYSFLCPTDAALARFPLVADAGLPAEPTLDFMDSYELARFFVGMKGFKDAVRLAGNTITLQGDSPDAYTLLAVCQQALGLDYMERRDREEAGKWFQRARAAFDRALERDPEHADALVGLTAFFVGMGEREEAERAASRAVRAHPDLWMTHYLAAQAAAGGGRFDEALACLGRAREVTRGLVPQVFTLAGDIHYQQGKAAEGRKDYEAAVKLHPGNLYARIGLARSYELEKQWDRALSAYQEMLGDFPRHHVVYYRIGLCQNSKGDTDAAAESYLRSAQAMETAGEVAPENFYLEYADILMKKGASIEAVRNLAMLLGNHGKSPAVVDAHLKASGIYVKEGVAALASAHHNMAVLAGKALRREVPAPAFQPQELDVKGIGAMMRFKYPPMVIKEIVENNRLAVNIAGAVEKIARENGIQELTLETLQPILAKIAEELQFPLEVVFWMFNSNLKQPPGQGGVAGGGQGPGGLPGGGPGPGGLPGGGPGGLPGGGPGPGGLPGGGPGPGGLPGGGPGPGQLPGSGQRPQQSPIAGGWEAQGMLPNVGYFRSWTLLNPDGSFLYKTQLGAYQEQGAGQYRLRGDMLVQTFTNTGQTFERPIKIPGADRIMIYFAEFDQWITWVRGSTTPPAW